MSEPIRLLLVEDDPVDVERVRRMLTEGQGGEQVQLEHAVALEQARQRVNQEDLDAVLLDLQLPDSSGIDSVTRLRRHDDQIPIVVFTASRDEATALAALQAGAQDYLVKDELASGSFLLRAVRCAMERQRLARESDGLSQRLAVTERMASLGVLSAGLAVGFNRLLGTVLDETDTAIEGLHDIDQRALRKNLFAARKAALLAGRMVEQLRDYAAVGSPVLHRLDLSQFLLETGSSLETIAGRVGVTYDVPNGGPIVVACHLQLYQVLFGLVTNAVEAIGSREGRISISAGLQDASAELLAQGLGFPDPQPGIYAFLRVSDTGCGIDPLRAGRIFDPFFTTKLAGRGLGLSAVLGIVRELRARIHVTSAPGEGATFSVLLPTGHQGEIRRARGFRVSRDFAQRPVAS